jgi:hypothetical protein
MSGSGGRRARPAQHGRRGEARRARPRPAGDPAEPVVEADGERLSEIDGEPLFALADAATAAVDAAIDAGQLVEEAVDDHDVRKHYPSGGDVLDDFGTKKRRVLDAERVRAVARPCVIRERCRLRRLRVV